MHDDILDVVIKLLGEDLRRTSAQFEASR